MGSAGVGRTFQLVKKQAFLAFSDWSTFAQLENIGRVKWDEYPLKKDTMSDDFEEKISTPEPFCKKIVKVREERQTGFNLPHPIHEFGFGKQRPTLQVLKILLPHVGLNVLLLSYIAFGAFVFMWLEAENELESRRHKLRQIHNVYSLIINETTSICNSGTAANTSTIEGRIRPLLSVLSRTHEYDERFTRAGQLWSDSEEEMTTRWSFAAAVLYALTVITSTGYDHVTPSTDPGRIFTVFFGLVGIPLMFITAADIGKFLSEIVIRSYGKLLELFAWIGSILDAIKDYLSDADDDSINSRKLRRERVVELDEEEDDEERLQLPIASYFALIVGYCAIGSLLFNTFEKGSVWSFIHGLFFSFNTITTIGLGNIYVRSHLYLALIVTYVIIGLAVITASLDLCSSTLKRTFTKLHYFGRKIRGARRGFASMSDDIREAMRIIAALKKTRFVGCIGNCVYAKLLTPSWFVGCIGKCGYAKLLTPSWFAFLGSSNTFLTICPCPSRPNKQRVTLEDLQRFLEVQEQLLRQPFVPYNVHIFRWIEDAYAQYYALPEEVASLGKNGHKISASDPILFF
uniref:Potassium channel subfamily K member 18 n=1 Tax=Steinernema glaseri TaxID=37863 RepID=A0A1I7ZIH2_9BILA